MDVGMLIDARESFAESGELFNRRNPMTGDVVTRAAAGKTKDVDRAVNAAAKAFSVWSKMGPTQRRAVLLKAADLFDEATPQFMEVAAQETGATKIWLGFNVMLAARMIREAAAMTTQISGQTIPSDKPGTYAMTLRRPVGVLVGMAPWNAPIILSVRAVAMPLACGNTVVLKASERCPRTHVMIGEIFAKAGLPEGALNVVTHSAEDAPEVVSALIAHPKVKRINFTGSTRVGKIIAEQAGRYLKPVLLELGGKAPMIVLDDADLDAAVNSAAFGAFLNQGQICMSTERIIVDEKIADAFVEKFAAKAASLSFGKSTENVVLGSVVDMDIIERVRILVDDATGKGGKLVNGGVPNEGTIMPATVVDCVTSDMLLYGQESFGPIVCVIRARDTEHAIELANDSEYGLSSAVFGSDINRAMDVASRVEAGICHINGPTVADEAHMPFGGMNDSGYGRFGGQSGVDAFTELRWVTIEDPHQHYPF
ncbi:aldehyde dehydrogenase [Agrobacterium tumefaciens]|uniref:Vanillin: NAD oxidoreductase n=1 Tax=Agrobacterium tumefaciens TaxID=358 RepID=A0A2L2LM34_AGRTU|nr:aldehyde dehydrogenase [Agrobacterium tumefaciens]AVH45394.1 vanillin: NAD oxidoreductase [Agrobacterium tumefaciens]NSY99123.1 aldehyde dehydrogenase [Agrobacterium tumefaciens]